jgi:putative membrane protein
MANCSNCGKKLGFLEGNHYYNQQENKEYVYCNLCWDKEQDTNFQKFVNSQEHHEGKGSIAKPIILTIGVIFLILCFIFFFIHFVCFLFFVILAIICIFAGLMVKTRNVNEEILEVLKKPHEPEKNPIEVLKLRYAKGEITKEQYEQMKKDVEK